jgi:hypothetical protein
MSQRFAYLAGGWVVALGVLLYGIWFLLVFYGACVGNVMIDSSRTKKGRLRSLFFFG